MDPNENLKRQRVLVKRILNSLRASEQSTELAELVEALDQWITNGGFLPKPWARWEPK